MTLYQHMGVAVAFSPRLNALLAETASRAAHLAPRLSLLHAGSPTEKKKAHLHDAIEESGLPAETEVHWLQGAPDDAILQAIRTLQIDFLVAGALEKERPYRYYLGSVAHNLVRQARSSLMLFTEPSLEPEPMRRIVFVTDFTENALVSLTKVVRFAEMEKAEQIYVLRVAPQYGEAMILAEGVRRERARSYQTATMEEEKELLRDLVDAVGHSKVPIEPHYVEGHAGYVAAQFVREQQADLLVMPTSDRHTHFLQRVFPSDMEWLLRETPCTLWVEREKVG